VQTVQIRLLFVYKKHSCCRETEKRSTIGQLRNRPILQIKATKNGQNCHIANVYIFGLHFTLNVLYVQSDCGRGSLIMSL